MKKNGAEHWHELYLKSDLVMLSSEHSLDLNDQTLVLYSTNQYETGFCWRGAGKKRLHTVLLWNKKEKLVSL